MNEEPNKIDGETLSPKQKEHLHNVSRRAEAISNLTAALHDLKAVCAIEGKPLGRVSFIVDAEGETTLRIIPKGHPHE